MRERPACFGQVGVIQCACGSLRQKERQQCTANRYFYLHVESIVKAADNAARHKIVAAFAKSHGGPYALELRQAAREQLAAQQLKTQASAGQPKGGESRRPHMPEPYSSVTTAAQAEA